MKQLIKIFFALLIISCWPAHLYSQTLMERMDNIGTLKYEDWVNTYRNYFAENAALGLRDRSRTGNSQVARKLWFYRDRLDAAGNIVNSDLYNWNAYHDFVAQNQQMPFATTARQTANWSYAGPYNTRSAAGIANGIGRVIFIKLDPNDSGNPNSAVMYVGAPKGGLWKTTFNKNTGLVGTWECLTDGLPNIGASDLCIHPSNRNIMYLVSGDKNDGVGNVPSGIGILKTTDGGQTWLPTGYTSGNIRKILMDDSNPSRMWAVTTNGIIRTQDGWQTYTTEQSGDFWDIEKGRTTSNASLIACTSSRVYTSADYGASWSAVQNNAGTGDYTFTSLRAEIEASADFGSNRSFYLWYVTGTFNSTTSNVKLFAGSTNTWTDKFSGSLVHVYKDYCMAFEVDPNNSDYLYIGGLDLKQSSNGGTSWIDISYGIPGGGTYSGDVHADQHYIAWDQNFIFLGNDGGVYNYNQGLGGWRYLSDGMYITQYYRLGYYNGPNGFAALGGAQDNGTHSGSTRIGCCDGMECLVNYNNPDILYISYQGANVQRSVNGGTSFVDFFPSGFQNGNVWITPMAMHKTNPAIIALAELSGSSGRIHIYNGAWSLKATTTEEFRWLAFAKSAPNVLYGVTSENLVKISDVTAGSPTVTTFNLPRTDATSITVDPNNSAHVFVCFGGYSANKVYESTNSGSTWTNISANLPQIPINCILMNESADDDVYIGTEIGVFVRLAGWNYWAPFMNGLPNTRITDLEIGNGLLTCATYGRGRWLTSLYGSCVPVLALNTANDPSNNNSTGFQYYTVSDSITSTRTIVGGAGTNVTYRAANSVTLKTGFHAKENNSFTAMIGPCFPGSPTPTTNTGESRAAGREPSATRIASPKYDYMKPGFR